MEVVLSPEEARNGTSGLFKAPCPAACDRCGGAGRDLFFACPACRGAGQVLRERTLKLVIPAGVKDGGLLEASLGGGRLRFRVRVA